ncbi:unnamed protein product, partial [Thlaspi arvense]
MGSMPTFACISAKIVHLTESFVSCSSPTKPALSKINLAPTPAKTVPTPATEPSIPAKTDSTPVIVASTPPEFASTPARMFGASLASRAEKRSIGCAGTL